MFVISLDELFRVAKNGIDEVEEWVNFFKDFYKEHPEISEIDFSDFSGDYLALLRADDLINSAHKVWTEYFEGNVIGFKIVFEKAKSFREYLAPELTIAYLQSIIQEEGFFLCDCNFWGTFLCEKLGIDTSSYEIFNKFKANVEAAVEKMLEEADEYAEEEFEDETEEDSEDDEEIIDPLPKRYEPEFTATNITYKASE